MLGSTVDTGGGGTGDTSGSTETDAGLAGGQSGDSTTILPLPEGSVGGFELCYEPIAEGGVLTLLIAGILLVGVGIAVARDRVLAAVVVFVLIMVTVFGAAVLTIGCDIDQDRDDDSEAGLGESGPVDGEFPIGTGGSEDGDSSPSLPSLLLVALIAVGLIGTVGLLYALDGSQGLREQVEDTDSDDTTDRTELGRAAGRAADQLAMASSSENAVYRAWGEMTAELPVGSPESSTPAEFATAAVEAGMSRENVDELTALFREVRYGDAEPTETRERRAIQALRRIETSHTTDVGSEDDPFRPSSGTDESRHPGDN